MAKKKQGQQKNWQQKNQRLKANHSWSAPKGYKIFVADRGAVSFNIPEAWFVAKFEPHLEIHDGQPPDDNARISVTFWHLPPGVDWNGLPLAELLEKSMAQTSLEILASSGIISGSRSDLELVWMQHRFIDPVEPREAITRSLTARGWDVQVLITFDFWADREALSTSVWDELVRSLQLGRNIDDPLKGPVLH